MFAALTNILALYATRGVHDGPKKGVMNFAPAHWRGVVGAVSDCGAGTSVFKVNSVDLDPVSPAPGQNMTLTLDYTVPSGTVVAGGQTEYDVTWNFIPLEPSFEPLCQDIPCPLGPGTYRNQSTSLWPDSVSGYITSQMKWMDEAGNLLLCIEIAGQSASAPKQAAPQPEKVLVPYRPHAHLRGGWPRAWAA
jgi:hypothetical protein